MFWMDGWKGGSVQSWMIIWMDIMNILQIAKEIWRCSVNTYKKFLSAGTLIYGQVFYYRQNQRHLISRPNKYARNCDYKYSVLTVVNCKEDLTLGLNVITNSVESMMRRFRRPQCYKYVPRFVFRSILECFRGFLPF